MFSHPNPPRERFARRALTPAEYASAVEFARSSGVGAHPAEWVLLVIAVALLVASCFFGFGDWGVR